ncbi:MAG: recombinase family protein [bacterium]
MQAYIYCRVSTEEQATDNNYSLENQEMKGKDCAKIKEWHVAEITKDVASGKDTNRPGYQELLKAIKNGRIDVVVVYRLDRLSRNVRDIYDFLDLIKTHDVGFVSLSEGFDTTTAMGRAMLGMAAVFAQLTREMIAENVKDGLMRRVQAGHYLGNHSGPYGYSYAKGQKNLLVVPDQAEIVRLIFDLFANRKWGVEKITKYLNAQYVPTRGGKQWGTNSVHRIIRNPTYVGKVVWHDLAFDGHHEPILTEEVFRGATELIDARRTMPVRSHQSQHLLSGIAECGKCGKRLVAHYGPKKADGARYIFYTHKVHGTRDECQAFHKAAEKLERAVIAQVRKASESDVLKEMAFEQIKAELIQKSRPLQERRQTLVAQLTDLKGRFNSWADRLDRGLIDEEQFREQNERLLETKKTLNSELVAIDEQLLKCEDSEVSVQVAKEALLRFTEVWDHLESQERREMLRQLVEKLQVYRDKAQLKLVLYPVVEFAL